MAVTLKHRLLFFVSGTVVGSFSTQYDNLPVAESSRKPDFDIMTNYMQIPEKETLQKGDFLRSLSVTPSPTIAAPVAYYTTTSTTATPAYSAYPRHTFVDLTFSMQSCPRVE